MYVIPEGSKVKVLYVAGMPSPVITILTGKSEGDITHAPGFFYPWYKLVEKGHQVDFVVTSNFNGKSHVVVDWFSDRNIYANIYDPLSDSPWYLRSIRRVKRFIKLAYYTDKAIRENDYDFVYCWAYYEGFVGNLVANFRGVPCGMRSMGTLLNHEFEKYGVLLTALRRPIEYLSFKMKKNFFIMTNDGSKGDVVYKKWVGVNKKYDFYFWKTGIKFKGIEELVSAVSLPKHKYLFFAARFEGSKRHDRILKILNILHSREINIHLYFAGSIASDRYYKEINNLIKSYGLVNYVHFLGPIRQDDLKLFAYNAVANPLMYNGTSLGNVFFETFMVGSLIIGLNDGSLSDYVVNNKNGFIVNDELEASIVVEKLIKDRSSGQKLRENAILCAKNKFLTIDERFDMEVELIESVAKLKKAKK